MVPAVPFGKDFSARIPISTLDHARDIGLSLLRTFVDRPSYVLGITSTLPGEGKSTMAFALTEVMALDFGVETLLIDAHAERSWFVTGEESPELGLSTWLSEDHHFSEAVIHVHTKCSFLPFGMQLLTSRDVLQYMVKIDAIEQLRETYSLLLVDLPDLTNPAAAALANLCDGICLVIESGVTPVDRVKAVLPLLQNVTMHGAILNRYKPATPAFIRRAFT